MKDKKNGSVAPVLLIVLISIMVITLATFVVLFLTGMISVNLNKEANTNQTNQLPLTENNSVDETEKNTYSISDMNQINDYIKKIYSYYETSIPEFDNINSADEDWLWAVSFFKSKFGNYLFVPYSLVQGNAKELFGSNLKKEFPKTEIKVATYTSKDNTFDIKGRGGNTFWPTYAILDVEKTSTGFNVKIVEYMIDRTGGYGAASEEEAIAAADKIYLCKNSESRMKQFKVGEERLIEDYVLENKDQFTSKLLTLTQDAQTKQLYITSSKNIVK